MALNLSKKLKDALKKEVIQKQLIVEIDGIEHVFGITHVKKYWRIGEDGVTVGQADLDIGGTIKDSKSKAIISNKRTQSNVTQQLDFEQGVSSVSSMKISLLDEDGILSRDFSPTADYDILGKEATVYWGIKDFSHPEDSVVIFEGIIDDCMFGKGYVDIRVSHPEQLKRQQLFPRAQSTLPAAINSTQTTITPEDISDFLQPWNNLECFIRIDDEIIKYEQRFGSDFINCTRGALNTIAADHDADADVISFYRLSGNPVDLALQLMISGQWPDETSSYATYLDVIRLNQVTDDFYVQNSIVLPRGTVARNNIVKGDSVNLHGGADNEEDWYLYPAGNLMGHTIVDVVEGDSYDYVIVSSYLTTDHDRPYRASFSSKYQKITMGCELKPKYIDIAEFERIKALASNEMVDCEIYVKDTVDNAKEFIDRKILLPQGLYSLPRKGKISVGKTLPPIADAETKVINHQNIVARTSPELRRSTNKNFYNTVRYEYHEDSLEDKFLRKNNFFDLTSLTKIKVGSRPLIIEAYSLRDNAETRTFIDAQAKRFLERFKFSSETVSLKVNLKTGFSIEVNDTAIVDLSAYKIGDITSRSRNFIPRLMQVVNKNLDMRSNTVTLELASTTFEVDGRYGTIAPSSFVSAGATTTNIPLKKMLPKTTDTEKDKWEAYAGQQLLIRSNDWSYQELATLKGVDAGSDALIFEPALTQAPTQGMIVDTPKYDDTDYREMALFKRLHAFINPSLTVVSGASGTQFDVSVEDMAKLQLDSIVYVHSPDYSRKSGEVTVSELGGTTVTVSDDLGFTPQSGDIIDLVGFLDGGLPYRLV